MCVRCLLLLACLYGSPAQAAEPPKHDQAAEPPKHDQAAEPPTHDQAEPPLRAGVLEDAAPFVVKDAQGRLTGFTVELFRLIAAHMNRQITFETADQPVLYAKLAHGALDVLPGPISATPDRAAEVLLTEGYAWSEYQFGARADQPVRALGDLKGRRLAVRSGSPYAEWAGRNAARYGFTALPAASSLAAAHDVAAGLADASLSGSPVQGYAAGHEANFAAGLSLPETRTHESAAVRRADAELRDEVEDSLRCLKMNGTVARLSKTWFEHEPDVEDLENLVVPGYGVPGLAGYDPKPRKVRC
jgi:polar amino acid transport system substrate-binding protein